jgi:hypothetical protein
VIVDVVVAGVPVSTPCNVSVSCELSCAGAVYVTLVFDPDESTPQADPEHDDPTRLQASGRLLGLLALTLIVCPASIVIRVEDRVGIAEPAYPPDPQPFSSAGLRAGEIARAENGRACAAYKLPPRSNCPHSGTAIRCTNPIACVD